MTLDDLELLQGRIFSGFRRFGSQQQLNDKDRPILSAT